MATENFWDLMAPVFHHQSQPLRPGVEDILAMEKAVINHARDKKKEGLEILMLGVTPEIATLSWPDGSRILAVESSRSMIEQVWPGDIPGKRRAESGNWFSLAFDGKAKDIIIGDGFLTAITYPLKYSELAEKFSGLLNPQGLLIVRIFMRPAQKETIEDIRADFYSGKFCAFDALKLRLGMALQNNVESGVCVGDIYRAWKDLEEKIPGLVEKAGWPRERVDMIGLYRDRATLYHFPDLQEVSTIMSPWFETVSVSVPAYEFGESYPTLVFRRSNPA